MTYQIKISDKDAIAIDTMLRKIASKKRYQWETLSSRMDFEDIVQELWMNAMEVINKKQRIDMKLIAHASFQKIVDLVRKEIRRPTVSIDQASLEWNDEGSESGAKYSYETSEIAGLHSNFISPEQFAELNDILLIFPVDSKHRKFLELAIGYFAGEADIVDINNVDYSEMQNAQENYWTSWIAHQLGYANACSSGFQKIRNQVQAKLAQLGYAEGFDSAIARLQKLGYEI